MGCCTRCFCERKVRIFPAARTIALGRWVDRVERALLERLVFRAAHAERGWTAFVLRVARAEMALLGALLAPLVRRVASAEQEQATPVRRAVGAVRVLLATPVRLAVGAVRALLASLLRRATDAQRVLTALVRRVVDRVQLPTDLVEAAILLVAAKPSCLVAAGAWPSSGEARTRRGSPAAP